jgi:hypothetical protein
MRRLLGLILTACGADATLPVAATVALNNPGSHGLDDPRAPSESLSGSGLAGHLGARGFVGVAVDYPGLGTAGTFQLATESALYWLRSQL